MNILNAKINWYVGYRNYPELQILVDRIPEREELRFECRSGIYFAEKDGYVEYYYYNSPGNGFGGRNYAVTMNDGSHKVLVGPWSSNSAAVMKEGFTHCMEVAIIDDVESFDRGYTFMSGNITLEAARKAVLQYLYNIFIVRNDIGYYSVSISQDSVQKIDGMICDKGKLWDENSPPKFSCADLGRDQCGVVNY